MRGGEGKKTIKSLSICVCLANQRWNSLHSNSIIMEDYRNRGCDEGGY